MGQDKDPEFQIRNQPDPGLNSDTDMGRIQGTYFCRIQYSLYETKYYISLYPNTARMFIFRMTVYKLFTI